MAEHKLSYKIDPKPRVIDTDGAATIGKNAAAMGAEFAPLEAYRVEWTHAAGPFPQHKLIVERVYDEETGEMKDVPKKVDMKPVPVIVDQINVRVGTPVSLVMQICEEKRERLAQCLGIEP